MADIRYKCSYCGKILLFKSLLVSHELKHTDSSVEIDAEGNVVEREPLARGSCKSCGSMMFMGYEHDCLVSSTDEHVETKDAVNHPKHYGGVDNPYEAIKVIDAWNLGFCLGNTIKYICREGSKHADGIEDLKKAAWYLNHEIKMREEKQ